MTVRRPLWLKIVHKIASLLHSDDFQARHRRRPQDFSRKRIFSLANICLFLLNLPRSALQSELDPLFGILHNTRNMRVVSAQAFSQARLKVSPTAFVELNQCLQQSLDQSGSRRLWQGHRLLAIDASLIHLPLEEACSKAFGTQNGLPTARLSQLFDVLDQQSLHSLIMPMCTDERGCAHLHLDHAPAGSLLLCDRGYPAQWLFAEIQKRGLHCLMRVKASHDVRIAEFARSDCDDQPVTYAPGTAAQAHWQLERACELPADPKLNLRLIKVPLASGETEILITSLTDTQAYPIALFQSLYHQRWGIETDFLRMKQALDLERFSGRSPQAVKQDLLARVLLKNLAMMLQHRPTAPVIPPPGRPRQGRPPKHPQRQWKPNFTHSLSCLKDTLVELLWRPCQSLLEALIARILREKIPIRPDRHFPRKRRRSATRGCEGAKPVR